MGSLGNVLANTWPCLRARLHSTAVHTQSMSLYGQSWFNSERRRAGPHPFSYLGTSMLFIYGLSLCPMSPHTVKCPNIPTRALPLWCSVGGCQVDPVKTLPVAMLLLPLFLSLYTHLQVTNCLCLFSFKYFNITSFSVYSFSLSFLLQISYFFPFFSPFNFIILFLVFFSQFSLFRSFLSQIFLSYSQFSFFSQFFSLVVFSIFSSSLLFFNLFLNKFLFLLTILYFLFPFLSFHRSYSLF